MRLTNLNDWNVEEFILCRTTNAVVELLKFLEVDFNERYFHLWWIFLHVLVNIETAGNISLRSDRFLCLLFLFGAWIELRLVDAIQTGL